MAQYIVIAYPVRQSAISRWKHLIEGFLFGLLLGLMLGTFWTMELTMRILEVIALQQQVDRELEGGGVVRLGLGRA